MRKLIGAINMSLDGIGDHTAGIPDAEIHIHYGQLIDDDDAILYGRITYQMMEFWRAILEDPTEDKVMYDFANSMDRASKIVFSKTLQSLDWDSARLATRSLEEEARALRAEEGGDIFVGSKSLITQLLDLDLIDELQICLHPVLAAKGKALFENLSERKLLKLTNTKIFGGGAIILYYQPIRK